MSNAKVPASYRLDVEVLWDYAQMHHEPRPADVGIGLGGHDIGVATHTANLYRAGLFPLIVFTGAHGPTTADRFPRGEAVHFRARAVELGVPSGSILVEPRATNTGENIDFTRAILERRGMLGEIESVLLISRPYQERRGYAICRRRWPEVEVRCGSMPLELDDYVAGIGDVDRVINMLVGDIQRIRVYPAKGWAIEQEMPAEVHEAYARLVDAGFDRRLLPE